MNYSVIAYSIVALAYLILSEVEEFFPIPEMKYFSVEPAILRYYLPLMCGFGVYFM